MAANKQGDSTPHDKLEKAVDNALIREANTAELYDTIREVIEKIGHSPLIMVGGGGWWEAFFHGLAQPVWDGPMGKFRDVAGYLQAESDYLNLDDEGFGRKFGDIGLSSQMARNAPMTPEQLQSLALRVAAFIQVRKELNAQGFSLPDNPDLEKATILVRSELAKDVRTRSSWEQLSGGEKIPKQLPDTNREL